MTRLRLSYFEMRGRAEAIRLLLHATETPFEDRRIVTADEWAAVKPDLPFGGLPILRINGDDVCESHTILRYLGKTLTSVASDALDCSRLDSTQDAIAGFQEDLWRFNWIENYYDHLAAYARDTLRPRLKKLENWFCRDRDAQPEWFGAAFNHVDCVAFCFLDEIDAFFPAVLTEFAALAEFRERVASIPGVSNYLASSARPLVFGMGRMGPKVDPRLSIEPGCELANPWSAPIDLVGILRHQCRLTDSVN